MENRTRMVTGVAWYARQDDWERLKQVADDGDSMDQSFSDWLINATRVFNILRSEGVDVRQVDINIDELVSWCRKNRLPNTSENRAKFTQHKVQQLAP